MVLSLVLLTHPRRCHSAAVKPRQGETLDLTVIHVNDIHSHFEEINEYTGRCQEDMAQNGECFGGVSRTYTLLNQLRDGIQDQDSVLFLNAGDYYQGTIWYTMFDYEPVLEFGNTLNYTAMAIGNHDFDDGIDGLVPFAREANFPLLAANLDEAEPQVLMPFIKKSIIHEVGGHKVGIVGYITADTPYISNPDITLFFRDVVESVRNESQRLIREEGVEMIIATGHNGYDEDIVMAASIPELDLVVGGHSHTFLYSDEDNLPSIETPRGPYPTYVEQPGGKVVPVVQAYCYSKYLGYLNITFNATTGDLVEPVEGAGVNYAEVILLDASIVKDPYIESLLEPYREELEADGYYEVIGSTEVHLFKVDNAECNIGDVITDSMIPTWDDIEIGQRIIRTHVNLYVTL